MLVIVLVSSATALAAALQIGGAFRLSSCVLRVVLWPRLDLMLHLVLFIELFLLQEGGLGAPEHDFR